MQTFLKTLVISIILTWNAFAVEFKSLPDFNLPDLKGNSHTQAEFANKVVIIDFWATWCAACKETIPALVSLNEKYSTKGLNIVGVSLDKGASNKLNAFKDKMKMSYLILHDKKDTLSKIFGFEGIPALYVFDRKGKLLKTLNGYSANTEKELEVLIQAQLAEK